MRERVGTVQRTQVLDLLSKALEEGYLELAEFEQRMTVVTAAKTVGELMDQVADLPPQFRWEPKGAVRPVPASTSGGSTQTSSLASLILAIVSIPLAPCFGIGAIFGIAAVVLSRPGLRTKSDYGKALTGLVVGCLGIAGSIVMLLILIFVDTTPTPRP